MARKEHLIWSSREEDYKFDEKEIAEMMEEEEMSDRSVYIDSMINSYLDDERMNLNIKLDNNILVIADLGLWNGRRSAYKIIKTSNIKDIFSSNDDDTKWYSDGYNIKGIGWHHDGTNYYEYRLIRNDVNIDTLLDKIYNQKEFDRKTINRYTKSIAPYVHKVYGW